MKHVWAAAAAVGLLAAMVPEGAVLAQAFDAKHATDLYLATISGTERAKSDAYFEGGYWLQLWDFLYSLVIAWLLLRKGFSARLRDWCEARTTRKPLQTMLFGAAYTVLTSLLAAPWAIYVGFVREHQYGMATQGFGAWFGEHMISLMVSVVAFSLFLVLIYAVLRRAKEHWWIWGTAVTGACLALAVMIAPVFIMPLFNTYTPLEDKRLEADILGMAEKQGVSFEHVYVVDASAQSTRISANVSGLGATKRISLNDNLLREGTLPEIRAVMGHELGHYVLGHSYRLVLLMTALLGLGYFLVTKAYPWVIARFGASWGIRGIDDLAGLPLGVALLSVYLFLATPLFNTVSRMHEAEADAFGLEVAREPDGFATISLKLASYRKLDPGALEEFVFYDHPSGRTRIRMGMDWKAAHMDEVMAREAEGRPQANP